MTYETAPGLSPLRLGIGDKVRLVFIDDSQQSEPPRPGLGHLLALGAVIVRDEQIAPYATTLAAIRNELGIPPGEEIKWKPPRDSFLAKAGRELSTELRTRMLQAAIDHEIRLKPGKQPPWKPLYGISESELTSLRDFIKENLANHFI